MAWCLSTLEVTLGGDPIQVNVMKVFRRSGAVVLLLLFPVLVFAQANGQLQIHQLNIGQGDAALIISPLGETMLIDTRPNHRILVSERHRNHHPTDQHRLTRLSYLPAHSTLGFTQVGARHGAHDSVPQSSK